MDRDRFDALTRLLASSGSRRRALGALLGTVLLGAGGDTLAKSRRRKHHGKVRGARAIPANCYSGTSCVIGKGHNNSNCDFSGSNGFRTKNVSGSNFSGSDLSGVDATKTNFKGANLNGACFVDAILIGANLKQTNTRGAIFCRTIMPDGSLNNTGCDQDTHCCRTCVLVDQEGCSLGGECCDGATCVPAPNGRGVCQVVACQAGQCEAGLHCCHGVCIPNTDGSQCCEADDCRPSGNQCLSAGGGPTFCACGLDPICSGSAPDCCPLDAGPTGNQGTCGDLQSNVDNCGTCGNLCDGVCCNSGHCGECG